MLDIKVSHKGMNSWEVDGSFDASSLKWSDIVHNKLIKRYSSFFYDAFICKPYKINLRYFFSTIPNKHSFIRIYWSSLIWPINLGFEFYEKIFTIRNPSIKAVCCFIRGIIPFNCSMIVD